MHDLFKSYGTALYLRRGMQKRAYYGARAIDYLVKAGALAPQQQDQDQDQQPRQRGLSGGQIAGIGAIGAAGAGAGLAAAHFGGNRLTDVLHNRLVARELGNDALAAAHKAAGGKAEYVAAAQKGLYSNGKSVPQAEIDKAYAKYDEASKAFSEARQAEQMKHFDNAKDFLQRTGKAKGMTPQQLNDAASMIVREKMPEDAFLKAHSNIIKGEKSIGRLGRVIKPAGAIAAGLGAAGLAYSHFRGKNREAADAQNG